MTAQELAARLANSAESVCAYLLPNGVKDGHEWCVGSVGWEAGRSLKVRLSGPRAGVWRDFAGDDGGDLLDLFAIRKTDGSIPVAMREAAEWLNIPALKTETVRPRESVRMKAPERAKRVGDGPVMTWLKATRKLADKSIRAYRLAERDGEAVLPAFAPDGTLQFVKYRAVPEKRFHSERGGVACLFGWQAMPDGARHAVICGGELDAVAWHSYGYPALSPTNGESNGAWIETEFDRLERFDTLYLSYDMDRAGQTGAAALVDRLGRDRCRLVKLPKKDANQCRIDGVTQADMQAALDRAASLDPDELVRVSAFRESVQDYFAGGGHKIGVALPWQKADGLFAFGAGELTILAGATGHGKSEVVNQLTAEAMRQGLKACVASMEFTVERWLNRMVRQTAALSKPSAQYIDATLDWLDRRMVLYGRRGTAKTGSIIEIFRYAARRYGVRWFVVDNLAKCGIAEDDYNGQKAFVDALGDFANDHRAHVILCAHLRKSESDQRASNRMDVKGSGAISDMADNVWLIRRNRRKEKAAQVNAPDHQDEPDAWFSADKVRDGDCEPVFKLWFHADSHQFVERENWRPRQYVHWTKTEDVA